jgi:alanyl-tRNA synthetase
VVEREVNDRVRDNEAVETRLMTPQAAIEAGAMALFGEKYGDEVRVLDIGTSRELCGGTHVRRTGDIGLFKVISEGAVGAGVRRIEAVTGAAAEAYVAEQQRLLNEAAAALKTMPAELSQRIAALVEERKRLDRELTDARKRLAVSNMNVAGPAGQISAAGTAPTVAASAGVDVGGVKFAARNLSDVPAKELTGMADELKRQIGSGVVALVAVAAGKASLVVGVTDDLTKRLNAVELVKVGSAALGGQGGGGRPDMAQAGGPDGARAGEALAAIERAIGDKAA